MGTCRRFATGASIRRACSGVLIVSGSIAVVIETGIVGNVVKIGLLDVDGHGRMVRVESCLIGEAKKGSKRVEGNVAQDMR